MNLGIKDRTAIVCGSSQGLGLTCAQALSEEGVHVVLNGRDQAKLDNAAAKLRRIARGDPKESGAIFAFLCSALTGFMSGQNIHLDGGSYPALI